MAGSGSLVAAQAAVTFLLLIVWLFSEFELRADARSKGSPRAVPRGQDRGSGLGILLAVLAVFIVVIINPDDPLGGYLPLWVEAIGDGMMVLGITIRVWSVHILGQFFTTRVTIQGDHRLIESGPYRWVRHPSYSGAVLTIFGFLLAKGGLLGLLAGGVLVPIAFGYRIHVEERALLAGLGEDYRQYMGRTRRLIPWVL
jgi:protein-S-isoprenylcysteine O-methyltransferase